MNAFKAARLFDPTKVVDLHPDGNMVEELKAFKLLERMIPDLKQELQAYLASAEGVLNIELLEWWMRTLIVLQHNKRGH